jgi:glycosyl transferase, family 25
VDCPLAVDWQIESDYPWWNRPLKWGEVGCTIAHLHCWQRAVVGNHDYCLVLEDDICFDSGLTEHLLGRLSKLSRHDFDLLYLGRLPLEPDQPLEPGLVRPGYSHCTYSYLLARHRMELVLAAGLESAIVPVDEFLPAMYADHPRPDLKIYFPRRLQALAFEPTLIAQLVKKHAGSDTEATKYTR